jgi:phosphoenolpyruvate-protein phosphotransferase
MRDYTELAQKNEDAKTLALSKSKEPAVTKDGHQLEIAANVGSASETELAVASGAEGVGLFRTEFLFLDRQHAPDEEEQYAAYRDVASALQGRPLIIRTLDAGGDKPIPYLNLEHEANPFMGLRAIRICLQNPELFKTQLRAIVRVAAEYPVKVMFPMIATLSEWREAKTLLDEAAQELRSTGQPTPERIDTGIMVEIPAAALLASKFADEVNFFSIGTNDLTQYMFAAERGNPTVQGLADALHPAVLQMIQRVVDAAHASGKWVGICGELAGNPQAIPALVGLGIDELSMSSPAIPGAKQIIRQLDFKQAQELAQAALSLETADAVRKSFSNGK